MKKAIASGLVGLIALGGGVAAVAPTALAQEVDDATRTEQSAERQAQREARQAQKVDTLTSALGISADDLQAAREAGDSIADIAAAQGVSLQSVIDALISDAQIRIDTKLADGTIDADRAAEKVENLEERITARVNGERAEGERGPRGDRAARGGAAAGADTDVVAPAV